MKFVITNPNSVAPPGYPKNVMPATFAKTLTEDLRGRAKLGDFCLELHSDKVSPKTVVASLAFRNDIGVGLSSIHGPQN